MKHIPYLDVDALVMEPQINNPPKKNDFAILTLKKPVEFGENIAPICLPHNPFRYYKDRVATLYGFGYNDTVREVVEEIARHEKITNKPFKNGRSLEFSEITIVSQEDCKELYGNGKHWIRAVPKEQDIFLHPWFSYIIVK